MRHTRTSVPPHDPFDAKRPTRADYAHGLPDHHDPLAGIGGAPPAYSALTLRLVLAAFGLVVCTAGTVLAVLQGAGVFAGFLALAAAIAVVDIIVIVRRKRRGEPG